MVLDRRPLDMENISSSSYRFHSSSSSQVKSSVGSSCDVHIARLLERRKIIYRPCEQLIKLLANLCRSRVDSSTLLDEFTMEINLLLGCSTGFFLKA